jgi:hypothetical protein
VFFFLGNASDVSGSPDLSAMGELLIRIMSPAYLYNHESYSSGFGIMAIFDSEDGIWWIYGSMLSGFGGGISLHDIAQALKDSGRTMKYFERGASGILIESGDEVTLS